jgi:hypothetical protein
MPKSRLMAQIAGGVAIAFGALTIVSGGRTLLGLADMGAVVPFVLWFNTLAGPAYILAGLGLWQARRWAFLLSLAIFAATLLAFAGLGLHIINDGAFEMRTVFAMGFRTVVWGGTTLVARLKV